MEFLNNLNQYLPIVLLVLQLLGGLVIVGTIAARLTPGTKDDELVGQAKYYWLKLIHFLPTLGINPQTQKLLEALEDLKLPPTPDKVDKP